MIEIHSHALPFMDDGAKSEEDSLAMLRSMAEQGVHSVIFTPHFSSYDESTSSFFARIERAKEIMKIKLADFNINFYYGAEVFISKFFFKQQNIQNLLISGTSYILLELPSSAETNTEEMEKYITDIIALKIQPILAHIERYPYLFKNRFVHTLKSMGCLFQVNSDLLFSFRRRHYLKKLFKNECVDFVSSDAHNTTTRPPNLKIAMEILKAKFNTKYYNHILDMEKQFVNTLENSSIKKRSE